MSHSLLTKKALGDSLKQMMLHTPLNKITVSDITNDCGFNRQTFYYHFQDIFELLAWIYKNEAVENIADYRTYANWADGFLKIFSYIEENKTFCLNTFHSLGRDHLETFLYATTYDLIVDVVREISAPMHVDDENIDFITNYYTISFIGLVIQWLRNGMKDNPRILVNKLNLLVHGNIEKGIQQLTQKDCKG